MGVGPVRSAISVRCSQHAVVVLIEGKKWRALENTYVALPADHFVAVVLTSQGLQTRFDDTATETEDEMESRFL